MDAAEMSRHPETRKQQRNQIHQQKHPRQKYPHNELDEEGVRQRRGESDRPAETNIGSHILGAYHPMTQKPYSVAPTSVTANDP
jgi:hypothetical protein